MNYKGFQIVDSDDAGGKAGRGRNKTSSVQIRGAKGTLIYVRYKTGEIGAYGKAITRAKARIDKMV